MTNGGMKLRILFACGIAPALRLARHLLGWLLFRSSPLFFIGPRQSIRLFNVNARGQEVVIIF
jgi:hypothetical protein